MFLTSYTHLLLSRFCNKRFILEICEAAPIQLFVALTIAPPMDKKRVRWFLMLRGENLNLFYSCNLESLIYLA